MHHLYASNASQHECTRESHIRFWHAFSHRFFSREFRVLISYPLHSCNCKVFFLLLSLSYFYLFAIKYFSRSLSLFTFPIFLEGTYLRVGFLTIRSQGTPLFRYIFTIVISIYLDFCSLFPIFSIVHRWDAYARTLYVAFSAFLSTENDLHHNLRPNIGGHTSRHNSRVPSGLNGRGRGDALFLWEKKGYGGQTRSV